MINDYYSGVSEFINVTALCHITRDINIVNLNKGHT